MVNMRAGNKADNRTDKRKKDFREGIFNENALGENLGEQIVGEENGNYTGTNFDYDGLDFDEAMFSSEFLAAEYFQETAAEDDFYADDLTGFADYGEKNTQASAVGERYFEFETDTEKTVERDSFANDDDKSMERSVRQYFDGGRQEDNREIISEKSGLQSAEQEKSAALPQAAEVDYDLITEIVYDRLYEKIRAQLKGGGVVTD